MIPWRKGPKKGKIENCKCRDPEGSREILTPAQNGSFQGHWGVQHSKTKEDADIFCYKLKALCRLYISLSWSLHVNVSAWALSIASREKRERVTCPSTFITWYFVGDQLRNGTEERTDKVIICNWWSFYLAKNGLFYYYFYTQLQWDSPYTVHV